MYQCMIKNYSFLLLGTVALLLGSCADPVSSVTKDEIEGPRMLKTVTSTNGNTLEKYQISDYGILQKIILPNQSFTFNYLGNTLKEIEVTGSFESFPSAEKITIHPNYNTAGQIASVTNEIFVEGNKKYREVTTIEYNNLGQPVLFFKISFQAYVNGFGVTYYVPYSYTYNNITYQGNNVVNVELKKENKDTTGAITSVQATDYKYEGFDWRPNPYNTMTKHSLIIMASYAPEMTYNLSQNNATKRKTTTQTGGQNVTTFSYKHDSFAYPLTNGHVNFQYQPIP